MLLNDVLRRLRFALSLDNSATISIFKLVDYSLEEDYLTSMMRREEEPGFLPCRDRNVGRVRRQPLPGFFGSSQVSLNRTKHPKAHQ